MSSLVESYTHNHCTIKIHQDEHAQNPRKDYDHIGTMVCWHRRYNLGDVDGRRHYGDGDDFLLALAAKHTSEELDDMERVMAIVQQHYVMLPLGLIDHSGISMYVGSGPHACDSGGWDSGQVGWIYVSAEKAFKEWNGTSLDEPTEWQTTSPQTIGWGVRRHELRTCKGTFRQRVEDYLRCEVDEYDQYLRGEVYGFVVEHEDTGEEDSCWGHYGLDYCKSEAEASTKHLCESAEAEAREATACACRDIVTT